MHTRYGTIKVFRDVKDVIGEIALDEREFFADFVPEVLAINQNQDSDSSLRFGDENSRISNVFDGYHNCSSIANQSNVHGNSHFIETMVKTID